MLTRSGWLVVVGSVLAGVAGRMLGTLELFVAAGVGATLVVVAVVWVRRPLPEVDAARHLHPQRPMVGHLATVELSVRGGRNRRLPVITLVDPVADTVGARLTVGPVAAGSSVEVGYRLPTRRRGRVAVGPLRLERTDPFGLARRRAEVAPTASVTVLPAIVEIDEVPMGGGVDDPLDGASQRALSAVASDDLSTLRPYVVGDDLRRVHWPSSAHADDLLVRRDEERWQGRATVLLDCRRTVLDPDEFEVAVSAAASVVHAVANAGDRLRLVTTAGLDTGMVDARRSEGVLLEELALVAQHDGADVFVPPPERHHGDALVVLSGADACHLVQGPVAADYAAATGHSFAIAEPAGPLAALVRGGRR